MAKRANEDLRNTIKQSGVTFWRIADCLGVSSDTFSRWMRHEMTAEKKKAVMDAIKKCEEEDLDLFE